MNNTSSELNSCQDIIESILCREIKQPMKNWKLIHKYIDVIKDIDKKRRELWHDEKFGVYEEMAENISEWKNLLFG